MELKENALTPILIFNSLKMLEELHEDLKKS